MRERGGGGVRVEEERRRGGMVEIWGGDGEDGEGGIWGGVV